MAPSKEQQDQREHDNSWHTSRITSLGTIGGLIALGLVQLATYGDSKLEDGKRQEQMAVLVAEVKIATATHVKKTSLAQQFSIQDEKMKSIAKDVSYNKETLEKLETSAAKQQELLMELLRRTPK